jgi:hypothetical protein
MLEGNSPSWAVACSAGAVIRVKSETNSKVGGILVTAPIYNKNVFAKLIIKVSKGKPPMICFFT